MAQMEGISDVKKEEESDDEEADEVKQEKVASMDDDKFE